MVCVCGGVVLGFPLRLSEARKALGRNVGSTAEHRGWVCLGEEEIGEVLGAMSKSLQERQNG